MSPRMVAFLIAGTFLLCECKHICNLKEEKKKPLRMMRRDLTTCPFTVVGTACKSLVFGISK